MQLGSGLKLIGKTGSATTVLGKNTAVLNFAPKASGSSKGALRSVELGGVTEILTGGDRFGLDRNDQHAGCCERGHECV